MNDTEQIRRALENVENVALSDDTGMVVYDVPEDWDEFKWEYRRIPIVETIVDRSLERASSDTAFRRWVLVGWHHDHADRDVGGRPEVLGL